MNDLKVFKNNEFGELGVLMIDGKEYFPATQCAKVLGYSNPRKAVIDHCKSDGVTKRDGVSFTTNQHGITTQQTVEIKYINEGNLYRLIVSSKLPAAEKFECWVFDEVLPEIRRTGSYSGINLEEVIAKTATAVVSEVVKQLVPVLKRPDTFLTNDVMYEEHIPSRKRTNRTHSIISHLDTELRMQVDDMLISEKFTYAEIKAFLAEYGIGISITAIYSYAKRLREI